MLKESSKTLLELPVNDIVPNPRQPRKFFDKDALAELAKSIAEVGVIQPIVVHPAGDKYEIIAGERRWRASVEAGLQKMPCIILDVDENSRQVISLVENIHRSDLSAIEEAHSIKELLDSSGWNQTELGVYLSRSQSYIANKIRLLKLDESVQKLLLEKKISERQARSMLKRFVPPSEEIPEETPPEEKKETSPDDPAAMFFDRLGKWAKENCARGIPISWTIKEISQSELIAEIHVDLKSKMR